MKLEIPTLSTQSESEIVSAQNLPFNLVEQILAQVQHLTSLDGVLSEGIGKGLETRFLLLQGLMACQEAIPGTFWKEIRGFK